MASPQPPARRRRFVVFEGTAAPSLRAAFAERPDWCDACSMARSGAPDASAHNARCHEALQRGGGGAISFCWRHMAPKHPDMASLVVNRWAGSEALTEKHRMLRALLCYYEAQKLDACTLADAALLPLSFELPSLFQATCARLCRLCPERPPQPPRRRPARAQERRPLASLPAWAPFAAAHAATAAAKEERCPASCRQPGCRSRLVRRQGPASRWLPPLGWRL